MIWLRGERSLDAKFWGRNVRVTIRAVGGMR